MKRKLHWMWVAVLAALSSAAAAHSLSNQECIEGSDFIKNAALSRENGLDGTRFISITLADFEAIKNFPPELRWFVQDKQDEDYLLAAVQEVFEHPRDPADHQHSFLDQCLKRAALAAAPPAD
jgi:hypothetical protein